MFLKFFNDTSKGFLELIQRVHKKAKAEQKGFNSQLDCVIIDV